MQDSLKNPAVDDYLALGCGRCSLGGTPQCKVHTWPAELRQLRRIALACGLTEEVKWSMPCYTFLGKNILMVAAFKEYAAISFFKGALLQDAEGLLKAPGENSQAVRYMPFTDATAIAAQEGVIKAYVSQAMELEKAGKKVVFRKIEEHAVPGELEALLEARPEVQEAFEALTPGRRRSHMLYIAGAKQQQTRQRRAEQCAAKIMQGKGWLER